MNHLDGIRKRPSMYIGSTDQHGLQHLVGELVSNSVDQFAAGTATQVSVAVEGESVCVSDDGPGFPLDDPELALRWLTEFHSSASADNHAPHVHVHGAGGVGIIAVNALSKTMEIRSSRNGQGWSLKCSRGEILSGPSLCTSAPATGTQITFVPDPQIFNGLRVECNSLQQLLRHVAYLFPGLRMQLHDEEIFAPNGLSDLASEVTDHLDPVEAEPLFSFSGRDEIVEMQVAAKGCTTETTWRTWCNGSLTVDGGTHHEGLSDALHAVQWQPAVALIHVVLHDPRYAGPTKNVLDVPEIREVISRMLKQPLREFAAKHQLGKHENRDDQVL